jgi:hypothetical protein
MFALVRKNSLRADPPRDAIAHYLSAIKPKEIIMATFPTSDTIDKGQLAPGSTRRVQIVMDHHGDTRHEFDAADAHAVRLAEERFRQLTGSGFRAAALSNDGSPGRLLGSFDATVERTLFIPRLKGG